ncbi:MAG TPA: hypothetical protein VFB60_27525 [Ktedonobacteraceae bacterium]|nr:hypothetical protein [Ktedonobacteraceae bacterium]
MLLTPTQARELVATYGSSLYARSLVSERTSSGATDASIWADGTLCHEG